MPNLTITATNPEDKRDPKDVPTVLFHQGKVYSGAEDGKIQVWNTDLSYVKEFQAHDNGIYSLAAIGDTLYSCGNDGKLRAWCAKEHTVKSLLHDKSNDCNKLFVDKSNNYLYAGDTTGFIGIYKDCMMVNHMNVVEEVCDVVASGKYMYTVRNLDVTATEILPGSDGKFAIKTSFEGKAPLALIDDRLCACSRDGKNINVYKINEHGSPHLFCTITGSEMIIQALATTKVDGQAVLYSGGWDKMIKRWVISGDKPLATGCAIVPTVINSITVGDEGQAYIGGNAGLICRLDMK